MLQSKKIGEK